MCLPTLGLHRTLRLKNKLKIYPYWLNFLNVRKVLALNHPNRPRLILAFNAGLNYKDRIVQKLWKPRLLEDRKPSSFVSYLSIE
jgi:hypothetical protein